MTEPQDKLKQLKEIVSKPVKAPERTFYSPPVYQMSTETTKEKMWRKLKENPLIPCGMAATVGALVFGIASFYKGNAKMSQKMMRMRVVAQGSTVLFLIGGLALSSLNEPSNKETTK